MEDDLQGVFELVFEREFGDVRWSEGVATFDMIDHLPTVAYAFALPPGVDLKDIVTHTRDLLSPQPGADELLARLLLSKRAPADRSPSDPSAELVADCRRLLQKVCTAVAGQLSDEIEEARARRTLGITVEVKELLLERLPPAGLQIHDREAAESLAQDTVRAALPTTATQLRGRAEELARVREALDLRSPYWCLLVGAIGGMGKTALAHTALFGHDLLRQFDLVLGTTAKQRELTFDGFKAANEAVSIERTYEDAPIRWEDYLGTVAAQLGVEHAHGLLSETLLEHIGVRIKGRSALVILDNLETLADTERALLQLRSICKPRHKVLITTRRAPTDLPDRNKVNVLSLRRLDDDATRALVTDRVQEPVADSVMDRIVRSSAGHPLAAKLLAGKLVMCGEASIGDGPLDGGADSHEAWFGRLFSFVFDAEMREKLGKVGVTALQHLARQPYGINEATFRKMVEQRPNAPDFSQLLNQLNATFVIERRSSPKGTVVLEMHPLTRAYFAALE